MTSSFDLFHLSNVSALFLPLCLFLRIITLHWNIKWKQKKARKPLSSDAFAQWFECLRKGEHQCSCLVFPVELDMGSLRLRGTLKKAWLFVATFPLFGFTSWFLQLLEGSLHDCCSRQPVIERELIQRNLLRKLNLRLSQYVAPHATYSGGPQNCVLSISIYNSHFGAASFFF